MRSFSDVVDNASRRSRATTARQSPARMGTRYRLDSFKAYGVRFEGERVLDVGCHDAALLSSIQCPVRVGVDLDPPRAESAALMVQADGRHLPFRSGSFDHVVAADVIEHVVDDQDLIAEMERVTRCQGQIFLTTPSADIHMIPHVLTTWISRQWGHWWRLGYTEERLRELAGAECENTIISWNAPAFRFWFLPMRLLWAVYPSLARRLIRQIAEWDARHREGTHGFYWMWCRKRDGRGT